MARPEVKGSLSERALRFRGNADLSFRFQFGQYLLTTATKFGQLNAAILRLPLTIYLLVSQIESYASPRSGLRGGNSQNEFRPEAGSAE